MEQDFLKELEFLGVTARIKRLSDALFYSIKELYVSENVDIEPGWHLVLLILKKKKEMSMMELASALNLSKPALTKMTRKMKQKRYVDIDTDAKDSRKKTVRLSEKARSMLPGFEQIWNAGRKAVREMLEENEHFMSALDEFEKQHAEKSFSARALQHLK